MKNNKKWFGLALAVLCSSMHADAAHVEVQESTEDTSLSDEPKALCPFVQMQLGYSYTGIREVREGPDSLGYVVPKINSLELGVALGAKQPLSDTLAFSLGLGIDGIYNIVDSSTFTTSVQPTAVAGAAGLTFLVNYTPIDAPVTFSVGAFVKHSTSGFQEGPGNLFTGRFQNFGFVSEFMLKAGPFDIGVNAKLGYATKGSWTSVNAAAARGLAMTKLSRAIVAREAKTIMMHIAHEFLMSSEDLETAKIAYRQQVFELGEHAAAAYNTDYEYGQVFAKELREQKGEVLDQEEQIEQMSIEEARTGLAHNIASTELFNQEKKLFAAKEMAAKAPGMQSEAMHQYQLWKRGLHISVTCGDGVMQDAIYLHGKEMPISLSLAFLLRWDMAHYLTEEASDESVSNEYSASDKI